MADIENGDVLRLGAGLIFEGVYDIVNVWHVLVTAGGGISYSTAVADIQEYLNALYDNIKVVLSDEMGTGNISLANVTQDTTFGAIAWSPGWSGSDGGEQTAPGVAVFVWARTLRPRTQIRKYFGVFGEVRSVGGVWDSTARTNCEDVMADHIASYVATGGLTMIGVAYNYALARATQALSVASSAEPAYQRRRKRGRGS